MSRRLEMPRTVWTHKCTVSLAPGAAQTLTVPIDAPLPEGESLTISMTDKEPPVPPGAGVETGAADTQAGEATEPTPAR